MVRPILNKTKIYIRRLITTLDSAAGVDPYYGEVEFTKNYGEAIAVKGQMNFKKYGMQRITDSGNNPEYKGHIIFDERDLKKAGLIYNEDESLNLKSGDMVESYEFVSKSRTPVNLVVKSVQPQAADFFTGHNKFLLVYAYLGDTRETTGADTI